MRKVDIQSRDEQLVCVFLRGLPDQFKGVVASFESINMEKVKYRSVLNDALELEEKLSKRKSQPRSISSLDNLLIRHQKPRSKRTVNASLRLMGLGSAEERSESAMKCLSRRVWLLWRNPRTLSRGDTGETVTTTWAFRTRGAMCDASIARQSNQRILDCPILSFSSVLQPNKVDAPLPNLFSACLVFKDIYLLSLQILPKSHTTCYKSTLFLSVRHCIYPNKGLSVPESQSSHQ